MTEADRVQVLETLGKQVDRAIQTGDVEIESYPAGMTPWQVMAELLPGAGVRVKGVTGADGRVEP